MKKTNKFSKGKTVGIVAASLAAVSLIGVGFSTWIIATKTPDTAKGIDITVAETQDKSVKISEAAVVTDDNSVNFDADHTKKASDSLLSCGDNDTQDMSFTISYKVTLGSSVTSWKIMAAIDDTTTTTENPNAGGGKFTTAVDTRKYIGLPSTLGIKKADGDAGNECLNEQTTSSAEATTDNAVTVTKTDLVVTVKQTFTFTWGLAFAEKNPVAVTAVDNIYTQEGKKETATLDILTANTKAMKNLELSKFNVILSVGTVG